MKITFLIISLIIFSIPVKTENNTNGGSKGFDGYHQRNDFLMASPGAMRFGLYGFDNPAILNYVEHPDFMFSWSDQHGNFSDFNRWGIFAGMPNHGFAMMNHTLDGNTIRDYRVSAAFGNRSVSTGLSYNWSKGDTEFFGREHSVTLGTLIRPNRYLSIGLIGTSVTDFDHYEGVIDLAVRPMGNEKVAVFGDYALRNDMDLADGYWSAGVAFEAVPGVRITGRYFDHKAYTFGVEFSLGNVGLSTQTFFDNDFNHGHNSYAVRLGSYDRNIIHEHVIPARYYTHIDLSKQMRYQRYRFMDKANSLIGVLDAIEASSEDPRVAGIAINATSISINQTMLWEVREELKKFKEETGKEIIVFVDNVSMNSYHFISIADKIVMDPQGSLTLPGYLMGGIYLNEMLEKIGIGVDEWRYHEYKSGFETFSGTEMSEEDREQRQLLVDNLYNLAKQDIMSGRGFSEEEYEMFVNEKVFFNPKDAIDYGLVDELGRWTDIDDMLEEKTGDEKALLKTDSLQKYLLPADNYWGKKPKIAVIYAEGVCDMERGIKAKSLRKDIEKAREDSNVKAVILRVESPGGSPLASDVVAEELLKTKEEKPVIITQGSVAASGGYWLSMYGDEIVAAPNTITGSIGVISGWFYDKGVKERIGYNTDYVKQGKFAGMGFGIPVPLLNIPLMDEKFDEDEEEIIRNYIGFIYDDFIQRVADGRDMEYDEVEAIAKGRVWSGNDALEIGLVDTIGGLKTAINIALEKSGIGVGEEFEIVEYPEPGFMDFRVLTQRLLGVKTTPKTKISEDPTIDYLKYRLENNTKPLLILPSDYMNFNLNDN